MGIKGGNRYNDYFNFRVYPFFLIGNVQGAVGIQNPNLIKMLYMIENQIDIC